MSGVIINQRRNIQSNDYLRRTDSPFFVAGERYTTQGRIPIPVFPSELSNSKWETTAFSYRNKASRPIRILEPSTSVQYDPEIGSLLSGISLITEILLD
jgi:hypothetical protein